jgi:hypothetical protein
MRCGSLSFSAVGAFVFVFVLVQWCFVFAVVVGQGLLRFQSPSDVSVYRKA